MVSRPFATWWRELREPAGYFRFYAFVASAGGSFTPAVARLPAAGPALPPFQELGDVQKLDLVPFAVQSAADIHHAAGIGANDATRAGRQNAAHLVIDHVARDVRIADRKRPAKAATLVLAVQWHIRCPFDVLNEPLDFARMAEHPQVAGEVIGDLAG